MASFIWNHRPADFGPTSRWRWASFSCLIAGKSPTTYEEEHESQSRRPRLGAMHAEDTVPASSLTWLLIRNLPLHRKRRPFLIATKQLRALTELEREVSLPRFCMFVPCRREMSSLDREARSKCHPIKVAKRMRQNLARVMLLGLLLRPAHLQSAQR